MQNLYAAQLVASARMRYNMREDQNFAEGDIFPEESGDVDPKFQKATVRLNLARTAVTLLVGTYASSAGEAKVIPGIGGDDPEGKKAQADAQLKNLVVRHHENMSDAQFQIRQAVKQAITVGIAWIHDHHYTSIDTEGNKTTRIVKEHEDWQRCVWDTSFRSPDFSDGRYFFAHRYLDKQEAIDLFPSKKELIVGSLQKWTPYENPIDSWESNYRGRHTSNTGVPSSGTFGQTDNFDVDGYYNMEGISTASMGTGGERMGIWAVRAWWREYKVVDGCLQEIVFYRDFLANSTGAVEWQPLSPANTWFFIPYTPIIYNREPKAGFPRGVVYDMKEPTRQINASIAQMINAGTSQRLLIEDSALSAMFADMPSATLQEKLNRIQQSMNRMDQLIIVNDGALSQGKIKWENNHERFNQANNVANLLLPLFQNFVSAVNPASLGVKSNADSGVAIGRMQQQTITAFKEPLDNFYLGIRRSGQKFLKLIEHFDNVQDFYEREDILKGYNQVSPKDILKGGGWDEDRYGLNLLSAKFNIIVAPITNTENEKLLDIISGFTRTNPESGAIFMPLMVRLMGIPQAKQYSEATAAMLKEQGIPVSDDLLSEEDRERFAQANEANAMQQQKVAEQSDAAFAADIGTKEADIKLKEAQTFKTQREGAAVGMEDGGNNQQIIDLVTQLVERNRMLEEQTEKQGMAAAQRNEAAAAASPGVPPADGSFDETQ